MLDIVRNEASMTFPLPFDRAMEHGASPEMTLLSRQTHALEFIASQLGQLTSRTIELPVEMRADYYELATRRLLLEEV